tara:strand:- start:3187 stop:3828 length:642 start_codon:yes stop_codon:yes gene_type:complete
VLNILNTCGLSDLEYWLVIRLYIAAFIPVFLFSYFLIKKKISVSLGSTLIAAFLITALGWELWLTYGIAGGLPVDERRSVALSCAIPIHMNWILNSLADVLIVWIGIAFVKWLYKKKQSPFLEWNFNAFFILLLWFIIQNIYVEGFFYNFQLGSNGDLSWAPMHPLGSWINPTLFIILGSPITLQAQSSWIIMTPIIYFTAIFFCRKEQKNKI